MNAHRVTVEQCHRLEPAFSDVVQGACCRGRSSRSQSSQSQHPSQQRDRSGAIGVGRRAVRKWVSIFLLRRRTSPAPGQPTRCGADVVVRDTEWGRRRGTPSPVGAAHAARLLKKPQNCPPPVAILPLVSLFDHFHCSTPCPERHQNRKWSEAERAGPNCYRS